MKTSINRLVLVLYVLANLTMQVADSSVQIQCPEVSYLNEPINLACSTSQAFSNTIYKAPIGDAPQCSVRGCTSISGFQAVPINSTYTQLTILRVQPRHAGQWGCADGDNNFVYSSLVVAERNPTCNITVHTCPDRLHKKISLNVTIQNYYCSVASNVSLLAGSVRETLSTGVTATDPTDINASKEINLTKDLLDGVQLEVICPETRNITCSYTLPSGCDLPLINTNATGATGPVAGSQGFSLGGIELLSFVVGSDTTTCRLNGNQNFLGIAQDDLTST